MKHNFRELIIWQEAMDIVRLVYKNTKTFPKEEIYGLTSQIKRASVSIPSNIAEGCGRGTDPQLIHFLDIALGSSCELETQLILANDLLFINDEFLEDSLNKINQFQRRTRTFRDRIAEKSK